MVSFPQVSPPEPFAPLSSPPYAPHAPPISLFSILPPAQYSVRSIDVVGTLIFKISVLKLVCIQLSTGNDLSQRTLLNTNERSAIRNFTSEAGGLGSIPRQSVCDLWWIVRQWDMFVSEWLGFPLSVSFRRRSLFFVHRSPSLLNLSE